MNRTNSFTKRKNSNTNPVINGLVLYLISRKDKKSSGHWRGGLGREGEGCIINRVGSTQ